MRDLIFAVILFVYLPVAMIAAICALYMFFRTTFRAKRYQWYFLIRALCGTLLLQTVFVLGGGVVIGYAFGSDLGYGFPAAMCLTTFFLGIYIFIWLGPTREPPEAKHRAISGP